MALKSLGNKPDQGVYIMNTVLISENVRQILPTQMYSLPCRNS